MNGFKELANAVRSGKTVFGTFMMLNSAWTARTVAGCGWDYVIVDCEHGNFSDSEMHDSVTAVAASGSSPIVRIRGVDAGLIKRALDTGAHGLMIPMISTAEEARQVVSASKFPPEGVRGQGSPFACWSHGITTADYVKTANQRLLTFVQIENAEGTRIAQDIAAVVGVGESNCIAGCRPLTSDALFIGPNDLHLALFGSAPADFDSKPFLDVLDDIVAAGKRAGKPVGLLLPNGEKAVWAMKRWGGDLPVIAIGGDVKALVGWMSTELATGKNAL